MAAQIRPLAADDPSFAQALHRALAGQETLAPLPPDPDRVLAMLQPERPLDLPEAAVIVTTSGSTGAGKGVGLSVAAIEASVHATHDRLGGPGDWVLAVPPHYVAGLMVMARAAIAGTRLLHADTGLGDLPTPQDRSYISMVPTQLVRGLADPRTARRLSEYAAVVVGGAAVAPEVTERAYAAGITVVATYGMSETCGGCVYDQVPLAGVRPEVDPETGRISLTTPTAFSGYRLRPELTAEVLSGHTVRTTDHGRINDGRLEVAGRLDDVVITGGIKVDLSEVEQAVRTLHPGAAVVGVPDEQWGTLIVAAVAAGTPRTDLAGLRDQLSERLPRYARPRALLRIGALPLTSSGKIDRQTLIAHWRDPGSHDDKEQV